MIEAEWWDYDDADELAEAVAGDIGFIADSAIDARDAALLALPGDAPAAILTRLAKAKLPWRKVTCVPTDDRLVAVDHEFSYVRGLAKALLPAGGRVLPIGTPNADVAAAGNAADARLQDLPWPPDLVWLTVGEDGHTAGLYPGPDLAAALDAPKARRAIGVTPDPMPADAPVARVTLTRAAILSARTILITCHGQAQRDLLETAIADGHSSKLPIGRLLAEADQAIDIHWLR